MATLELKNLTKRFGEVVSLDTINLFVDHGEFVCLLGPSGCGKTTTLRMIAGFLEPDAGEIRVGGETISAPGVCIPPERRNMSMIFQSYAVWPHMTVNQNVAYPLNMKRVPADDKRSRVDTLLDATQLKAQADRYPSELSGGQQQRVALARALAPKPDILLMDEPLSNLDASLRGDMRLEIRRLHDHFRYTSIYVTHDQTEAMTMADRIVVMNGGRIEQIGTPEDVYEQPNSEFVARFIGGSNVIKVTHVAGNQVDLGGRLLEIGHGDFAGAGKPMSICVKTHDVELLPNDAPSDGSTFPGRVRNHAYLGSHRDYVVDVGQDIVVAAPSLLNIPNGQAVSVRIKADRCRGLAR